MTQELAERGLFEPIGIAATAPMPFHQSVDESGEAFQARNERSRDRMTGEAATGRSTLDH